MARKPKAYLNLEWIICVILAIIPVTNIVLGILHRLQHEKLFWAIMNIIPFFMPFFWIIDLISIILHKDIKWLI